MLALMAGLTVVVAIAASRWAITHLERGAARDRAIAQLREPAVLDRRAA